MGSPRASLGVLVGSQISGKPGPERAGFPLVFGSILASTAAALLPREGRRKTVFVGSEAATHPKSRSIPDVRHNGYKRILVTASKFAFGKEDPWRYREPRYSPYRRSP